MNRSRRVLIVDDSRAMQMALTQILSSDPDLEVIGAAADAHEARAAIKELDPDVVTLDVEMPNMNGLDFLERLMRLRPTPVVMVSSQTLRGAETTIRALELGAFDCVAKPNLSEAATCDELRRVVRDAADGRASVRRGGSPVRSPATVETCDVDEQRLIAMGASTGGVEALISILSCFPTNCPPTVITQHMPAYVTKPFAARLDRLCPPRVMEATHNAPIEPGLVYVAPGGARHLTVRGKPGALRCHLEEGDPVNGHRPSIDVLFESVAKTQGALSVGVILTGMGRDGAAGLAAMRRKGALTFGQSEESCVVYGMPKVALNLGAVQRQASPESMAAEIFAALDATR